MKDKLFSYNYSDTFVHRLSGLTKLTGFLMLTFAVMFSYDIRVILAILVFSFAILKLSGIHFRQIRLMIYYVALFIAFNAAATFFFAPERGAGLYGTRHVLLELWGPYSLTREQLFFQITKIAKYFSVIPLGIIFLLTTNPSEFASALNGVGVHYKAAYAVALTLRYFPDIQREYRNISLSQQARGLDISKKARFRDKVKNSLLIIIPLVFSTLDRIELISNAMDLRGFGKNRSRTWYSRRPLVRDDYIALLVSLLILGGSLAVSAFINHGRYYNPFQ